LADFKTTSLNTAMSTLETQGLISELKKKQHAKWRHAWAQLFFEFQISNRTVKNLKFINYSSSAFLNYTNSTCGCFVLLCVYAFGGFEVYARVL